MKAFFFFFVSQRTPTRRQQRQGERQGKFSSFEGSQRIRLETEGSYVCNMYACMYCMYICMYVCMYVCILIEHRRAIKPKVHVYVCTYVYNIINLRGRLLQFVIYLKMLYIFGLLYLCMCHCREGDHQISTCAPRMVWSFLPSG